MKLAKAQQALAFSRWKPAIHMITATDLGICIKFKASYSHAIIKYKQAAICLGASNMNMSELATMPLADRLQAMEILWASLAHDPSHEPSPAWHQQVIEQRLARLEAGKDTLQDWDEAKKDIRATIEARRALQGSVQ
jgi:putative addiction module component (TIGR02574 family)